MVIACNSATAAGLDLAREVAAEHGVEVVAVIDPEARDRGRDHGVGRIGVLATPATVRSGAYRRALERQGRKLEVTEVAAADLAPIIQHGFPFDEDVVTTVRSYCAPLQRGRGRHRDPRLHPLSRWSRPCCSGCLAGTSASSPPATRWPRQFSGCSKRRARDANAGRGRLPLPVHRRHRLVPRARHPLPADAAGRVEHVELVSRPCSCGRLAPLPLSVSMSILEQVQADTTQAMKAGERDRVVALRMLTDALQQDAKLGDADEVAALQRERKRRLEAIRPLSRSGSAGRPADRPAGGGGAQQMTHRRADRRLGKAAQRRHLLFERPLAGELGHRRRATRRAAWRCAAAASAPPDFRRDRSGLL